MAAKRPTLLIDFDGVIHPRQSREEALRGFSLPLPNVRAALYQLERYFRLVVFTARTDHASILAYNRRHGFPNMKVTNKKEPGLLLDDQALTFPGVWTDELLQRITSFTPHWKRDGKLEQSEPEQLADEAEGTSLSTPSTAFLPHPE